MASILSTRKLAPGPKELLLNAGHSLVEQDFISIIPLEFEVKEVPENIIFTSKNAVKMVLGKVPEIKSRNIFCVGEKTAAFLKEKGLEVKETAHYGRDLAEIIAVSYQNEQFLFFCGRKRRNELPQFLSQKGITVKEIKVYNTELLEKKLDRTFDGILFFSPSAVRSFCAVNDLSGSTAFCIGKTTASEAGRFTDHLKIANKPSVENVIVQVVKHFGKS